MKQKKSKVFMAAAVIGAAAAACGQDRREKGSLSDDESVDTQETDIQRLIPISSLAADQQNIERVSREAIRTKFLQITNSQTAGKKMILAVVREDVLSVLGYKMDTALDSAHYLFWEIRDAKSGQSVKEGLINFVEMESGLKELLDEGRGIIRIDG